MGFVTQMAFNLLRRPGLLPQAMQRSLATQRPKVLAGGAAGIEVAGRGIVSLPSIRQPALMRAAVPSLTAVSGMPAVRSYGTRSVWNVARGKYWILVWFGLCTVTAGAVQDYFGPYWFF